ncbi:MAG: hypothetical protein EOM67_11385 [Spirochaetia bacterium]|nr:hypothetical protein [Spirochaetia bacterium]
MSTRGVLNTPQSDHLEKNDILLLENGNLTSTDFGIVSEQCYGTDRYSSLPQVYSVNNKGGVIATRGQVFTTATNLSTSAYGGVGVAYTLYVGILNTTLGTVKFGSMYATELKATILYDDATTEDFNKDDATVLNALFISPYGLVEGTEDWMEA